MSDETVGSNPFSGLFSKDAKASEQPGGSHCRPSDQHVANIFSNEINNLVERVFLFTIRKCEHHTRQLVFMEEIANQAGGENMTYDLLERALFERLLLPNPTDFLIPSTKQDDMTSSVVDTRAISYLYRAFKECHAVSDGSDIRISEACKRIRELIMRNACTALKQPELFEGQSLPLQWLQILQTNSIDENHKRDFLYAVTMEVVADDAQIAMGCLKNIFYPMLSEVLRSVRTANLVTLEKWLLPVLNAFAGNKSTPQLGELLLDFTTPNPDAEGVQYSETLFGQLLSLSILPKNQNGPYEFYENPADSLNSSLNASFWDHLKNHLDQMHDIFKSLLLLDGVVKHKTLLWIGNCLHANLPRGQIWNTHNLASLRSFSNAPDSFMIGFCGILLRLCRPLLKPSFKVLLVDPTYCAVADNQRSAKNVHMRKASDETCLLPNDDRGEGIIANSYNFVTELFYMTHKAIDLSKTCKVCKLCTQNLIVGYRVCTEKFIRMSREIHRVQSALQDAMAQGHSEVVQNITQMLTTQTQQFLCLKSSLTEPYTDQLLVSYYEATAVWLIEVTSKNAENIGEMLASKNFAPKHRQDLPLPIESYVPPYLRFIPEYILENIIGYLAVMRHLNLQAIELDTEAQSAVFRMILCFMGSVDRARNPHLRAKLAEGLESLVPKEDTTRSLFKTNLFLRHPDRLQIVPNLLDVFVSIEMTGQSVQFEQKFNYRRPMYSIMEFLWGLDEQRNCFKCLAHEAEISIEAVDPPTFLRFINLLINDAIFLLDESLSNLQQIRTLQSAQDNGEWNNLPATERQQNAANLQHLGMMARFDNILGRDTINILKLITNEIKAIFCHASMVDRVAAMLNYFLLHLVGPKKGNFKVRDKKEFEFDPALTVMEICRIYINLKESDQFCLAVSQDGRSYSSELFEYAEQVLARIGGGQLISEINELSNKVEMIEKKHKEEQEALTDPPDEYLDPIMSTLMLDPVILPSSNVTVDRSTIARHLLSDQSDPFNRAPLTMDQVKSNTDLRREILSWIERKRKSYSEKILLTNSPTN